MIRRLFIFPGKLHQKLSALNDTELIARYTNDRDPAVIEELFQRYAHLIYGICLKYLQSREESKDATLHIFQLLQTKIPLQSIDRFPAWLHVVVKNHCLQQLRKKRHLIVNLADSVMANMQSEDFLHPNNKEQIESREMALHHALSKLNPAQQDCLIQFYFNGHSYQQIAIQSGYTLKEVKSHIQNGKRNLKMLLKNE